MGNGRPVVVASKTMMREATGGSRDAKMVTEDKRVGPKIGSTTRTGPPFFLRFSRFGLSIDFRFVSFARPRHSTTTRTPRWSFFVCARRSYLHRLRNLSGSIHAAAARYPTRLCHVCDSPTAAAPLDPTCSLQYSGAAVQPRGWAVITDLALTITSSACRPPTRSASVVCPRALPMQTCARPCSAGPNLPVRCLTPAIGSAHGLAIQQAHTSPPIPSCPHPPPSSPPCTARLWKSSSLKWPPLDPTSARRLPQGLALGTHRLGVQITAHSHTLGSSPDLRSPARCSYPPLHSFLSFTPSHPSFPVRLIPLLLHRPTRPFPAVDPLRTRR
ncbi:hypothetical protein DFH08DRAFT_958589 [Mycena albidolilacea]|uniref:Uncharacterized protein n=1 Tax=Mycena albidolilacea TaxID=1033008 RepID=A0AAD7A5W5_9AGAR|nr:hypothetical protein DFH08DRAFT_958589 [Mycena albidolilacea]